MTFQESHIEATEAGVLESDVVLSGPSRAFIFDAENFLTQNTDRIMRDVLRDAINSLQDGTLSFHTHMSVEQYLIKHMPATD